MTFVKICGTTNREDAHAAIDLGADALGFVAIQESPRYISARDFERIREVLPPDFPLVVVAKRLSDAARYHAPFVQYYDEGSGFDGLDEGTKRIRVYRVRDADDIAAAARPAAHVDAILLDASHAALLGGSGTRFDWELARDMHRLSPKPFVLAGGLNPANVAGALAQTRPYAVDVSSGVEDVVPGKKNADLIRKFIRAVREWDEANAPGGSGARGVFLA